LSDIIKSQSAAGKAGRAAKTETGSLAMPDHGFTSFSDLWQDMADPGSGAIVGDPFKARAEIRMARSRGDIIIEEARAEAERLKAEGLQQGLAEGRQQAAVEAARMMRQYEELLGRIQAQRADLHRQYEEDVITLVKAMIEQLVNHEVTVNPRVIQACLRKAMGFVVEQSEVRVRLHPEDFQRIKAAGLDDPALLEGRSQVHLVEDPTVSMGGCFLESSFGEIDATLECRREQLFAVLDEAFRAAQAAEPRPDDSK